MEQETKERRGYEIEVFMARMSVMILLVIIINALIISANTTSEHLSGIDAFGVDVLISGIVSLALFPVTFIEYLLLEGIVCLLTKFYKFARRHR
jgi:hypothetical protein